MIFGYDSLQLLRFIYRHYRQCPHKIYRISTEPPSFRTLSILADIKKRGGINAEGPFPQFYYIIRFLLPVMYAELDRWDWDDALLIDKVMEYYNVSHFRERCQEIEIQ